MARPFKGWPEPWPSDWRVVSPAELTAVQACPLPLQKGDVILFCPDDPNSWQNIVVWSQEIIAGRGRSTPPSARFTHAALYVGHDNIIDATPRGDVAERPLAHAHAVPCHLRVRRFKGITQARQDKICDEAQYLRLSGAKYNVLGLAIDALLSMAMKDPDWIRGARHIKQNILPRCRIRTRTTAVN